MKQQKDLASFRLFLLVLMVLQNTSTVLVGRHTRNGPTEKDMYVVNHLIVITEVSKLILSGVLEFKTSGGLLMKSIQENIVDRPKDALKISVPSLLYLVQNSLLYVALGNLSAPLFQVTYQGKLLTTALVSVILLQRTYSTKQWVCLTTLGLGVAVVVLGEQTGAAEKQDEQSTSTDLVTDEAMDDSKNPPQDLFVGLIAVTIACLSSALAGVYFEKVLKKPTSEKGEVLAPVSVWMRNIQLAFFSVIIAFFQYLTLKGDDAEKPFLHGFTFWVWILVLLQAGGGLLVAAVIKYADNVLKGLATGVSVVLSSGLSILLFGTPLTAQFTLGAAVILLSVYLFSNDVPGFATKDTEMKPILPK